jgi:adenylate cyclase, class 2
MDGAGNIELKARLNDLPAARQTARRVATKYLGFERQTDTYFQCPQGRMKLREIVEFGAADEKSVESELQPQRSTAQLISYDRADEADAKESHYQIVEIRDPERVRELKLQMGIRAVVVKQREIFLQDNVRIHLDEVSGLGTFLEFEAVLGCGKNAATGRAQVTRLQEEFGIEPEALIANSYVDLLSAK